MVDEIVVITYQVRAAAKKEILFLPHAIRQMNKPERMISAGGSGGDNHSGRSD